MRVLNQKYESTNQTASGIKETNISKEVTDQSIENEAASNKLVDVIQASKVGFGGAEHKHKFDSK